MDDQPIGVPELHGQRVLLRRVRPGDEADRLACGRDADAVRMYGGDADTVRPFTAEDARRWYASQLEQPHGWVMEVEGRCIGSLRLHSIVRTDRRARLAIGIDDPMLRGRGIGTEAIRLVLSYAFDTLGLHRVDLRVLEYNERGIACYEKCGFVREGIERESALVGNVWYSDVMMAILEQEYRARAPFWH
jgi:[ribosomal protein S5]-alanine N-acetyltransferase